MKKIVSAAVAASLLAGAAFADVTVKLNSRTRPSLLTYNKTYADDASTTTTILDFSNAAHSDDLQFSASGEKAGITAKVSLANAKATYAVNGAESPNGSAASTSLSLGEYYGWLTFGGFKLTAGNFDSRFVNRYNKSLVEEGLTDSNTAKWGVSNFAPASGDAAYKGWYFYDFNNFVAVGGNRQVALVGDYTFSDVGPGKLLLKAGVFANNFTTWAKEKTDITTVKKDYDDDTVVATDNVTKVGAGFAVEAAYQHELLTADVVFKMPSQHALGVGLYVDVKAVDNLTLAAGFTFANRSKYTSGKTTTDSTQSGTKSGNTKTYTKYTVAETENAKAMAYAADLRLFYQVSDPLLVGLQAKFSSVKVDGKNEDKADTGIEAVATAQYKVSDALGLQFDAGLYYQDLDDAEKKDLGENYIKVRPAVKINASSVAAITTAVELTAGLNGGDTKSDTLTKLSVKVPFILRIKL